MWYVLWIEYVSTEDSAVNRTITFRRKLATECVSLLLHWTREYTVLSAQLTIDYAVKE